MSDQSGLNGDDIEDVVVTPMDRHESEAFMLSQSRQQPPPMLPDHLRPAGAPSPTPPAAPRKRSCCSKTGCLVILVLCAGIYFFGEIRDLVEEYRSDTPAGLVPEAKGRGPKKPVQQQRMNREVPPEEQVRIFTQVDGMTRSGLISDIDHSANSLRIQEARWRDFSLEDKKHYLHTFATYFLISRDSYLGYRTAKIYSDRNNTLLAETGLWGTSIHE